MKANVPDKERRIRKAEFILIGLIILVFIGTNVASKMIPAQNPEGSIREPSDLNGQRFVSIVGSAFLPIIEEEFPDSEVLYVSDWVDEDLFVIQNKADAFVCEYSSAQVIVKQYPELTILPQSIGTVDYVFGFGTDEFGETIEEEMDDYIEMIREDGTIDEIWARWSNPDSVPDHVEPSNYQGVPRGTINIVTSLDWFPMCYQEGNEMCGFFIDLTIRFCEWAGYDYEFTNAPFTSALTAFSVGRYDMFCYGLLESDEAAETINFSDTIFEEPIYVIIAKNDYVYAETDDDYAEDIFEAFHMTGDDMMDSIAKNFLTEDRWQLMLSGLKITIELAFFSGLFGTLLGALICFMRMSRITILNALSRIYIKTIQGIPITVLLMILFYVLFAMSPITAFWVSIIGFSLDFSAYCSEIIRSGIESVPSGQKRAAMALGFSGTKTFFHVILPQAVIHILPVYIGQFISMVKATSVAGYISVLDLTKVTDIIRSRTYEAFFPLILTAVTYFIVAWLLTLVLRFWRKRIDPETRSRKIKGVTMHD